MSNASNMKQNNTIAIMQLLQREGGMTKNNMAAVLQLSNATVHNIVTELKEKGFCKESTVAVSTGGRNAVVHEINKDGGFIIGQTLFRNKIVTNVFDYGLNILLSDEVILHDLHDITQTIRLMIERIKHCMDKEKGRNFVGVGISMMARVDNKGKIINITGYPEWRNVHLKDILASEINLPIFIENDNNAATLAWKWSADTEECENAVFYHIGEGVGMGVMMNGKLFGGSNNNGCEFGHVSVMLNGGPLCTCGNYGCLEAFVKDEAIINNINQLPDYQNKPIHSIQEAVQECRTSEAVAQVFSESVYYIAVGVEHIIKLFDPELIVIRNRWMKEMPQFFAKMQDILYKKISITDLGKINIRMDKSKVGEVASACVFLERFYSGEAVNIYL